MLRCMSGSDRQQCVMELIFNRECMFVLLHTSDELGKGESGKDELEPLRVVLQNCALQCVL